MQLSISSPGTELKQDEIEQIHTDLEKINRRFKKPDAAQARLRVRNGQPSIGYEVVLEIDYRRLHFLAKAKNGDVGKAVREAREEILRQISDAGRGGHSSHAKGT